MRCIAEKGSLHAVLIANSKTATSRHRPRFLMQKAFNIPHFLPDSCSYISRVLLFVDFLSTSPTVYNLVVSFSRLADRFVYKAKLRSG